MLREIDERAITAKTSEVALQQFIEHHKSFILAQASENTKRFVTTSHDEWSIALHAFVQAINDYQLEKGSFLPFASLVIRRKMIDFYRQQTKFQNEISINPAQFSMGHDFEENDNPLRNEIAKKVIVQPEDELRIEIQTITPILRLYGFAFFDLVDCSPKAQKTKLDCARVVGFILSQPLTLSEMRHTKQLPIRIIEKKLEIPRKTIERHRKYIIAVVEILSGDYPYLTEFLKSLKEEMSR